LKELVAQPHSLAIVLTAATRNKDDAQNSYNGYDSSNSNHFYEPQENRRKLQQQTLLILSGPALPLDTMRWCVPVMGLTSFLREWSALMSIRNHRLMPLAPYLLKGSPVVSSQHLRFVKTPF
jgi:hypothetical protein